jgi:hypothetical protein
MSATTSKPVQSEQEKASEQALAALRKLGGAQFREEAVVFEGKKVILPEGSTLKSNIDFLKVLQTEEQEVAQWQRVYKFRPYDGIVALQRALKAAFGAMRHQGSQGFFGPNPPRFIEVAVGIDETEQVVNFGDPVSIPAFPDVTFIPSYSEDPELGHGVHAVRRRQEAPPLRGRGVVQPRADAAGDEVDLPWQGDHGGLRLHRREQGAARPGDLQRGRDVRAGALGVGADRVR